MESYLDRSDYTVRGHCRLVIQMRKLLLNWHRNCMTLTEMHEIKDGFSLLLPIIKFLLNQFEMSCGCHFPREIKSSSTYPGKILMST